MSIEIRQMIVNATVKERGISPDTQDDTDFDPELFRMEIMEACSEMIRQQRREERER